MSYRSFARRVRAFSDLIARIELVICQVLVVGFAGLLLVNVLMRYLLSAPLYFAEELATYLLIWMAFLAISVTIAKQQMISLTFLVDPLPDGFLNALQVLVNLLVLAICVTLTWISWNWLNSSAVAYEQALTLGVLKKPFYTIVPLFFFLASLHTFSNLLCGIWGPDPETTEHRPLEPS